MFVSVTRLRIRRLLDLPKFLWHTRSAEKQACKAEGFLGGRLLVDRHRVYWTLTGWESEKAMKAYRGAGTHGAVMKRLPGWCDEAVYAHWESSDVTIPAWPDAYDRLKSTGNLSRVEHPSPSHEAREFPAPRLQPMIGGELKPKPDSHNSAQPRGW